MLDRPLLTAASVALAVAARAGSVEASPRRPRAKPAQVSKMLEPLRFEVIGDLHGASRPEVVLPHNDITAFAQDQNGVLWIGTRGGLASYDGARVRTYRASRIADSDGPRSSDVTGITIAAGGDVWCATGDLGVSVLDRKTGQFVHLPVSPTGLSSGGISALHKARDGSIWIGHGNGVVERWNSADRRMESRYSEAEAEVSAFAEDPDGNILFSTRGEGLFKIARPHGAVAEPLLLGLPSLSVRALVVEGEDFLWIGTGAGLVRRSFGSGLLRVFGAEGGAQGLTSAAITRLLVDRRGVLWIGTESGLNRRTRGGFDKYRVVAGDARTDSFFTFVTAAFEDRSGLLWFGDLGGGIRVLDPLRMAMPLHSFPTVVSPTSVYQSSERPELIWVGSAEGGLYKYDRTEKTVTQYTEIWDARSGEVFTLEGRWITGFAPAEKEKFWLYGDGTGLILFDPVGEQHTRYSIDEIGLDPTQTSRIQDIAVDRGGRLWIATWGGGVAVWDPATGRRRRLEHVTEGAGLASNHVMVVQVDKSNPNRIWLGHAAAGLEQITIDGQQLAMFAHDPADPHSISHNSVQTILQATDDSIWIGTAGGGISSFSRGDGHFVQYSEQASFPDDTVFGLMSGNDGRIWATTGGAGIVAFDPRTRSAERYLADKGAQGREYVQGCYLEGVAGELFACGVHGVNAFFPSNLAPDPFAPNPLLTGTKVVGDEDNLTSYLRVKPQIELGYKDDVLVVDFAVPALAAPDRVRYFYQIEGLFDDKWVPTEQPTITLTHLDGGEYAVRVKAANRDGRFTAAKEILRILQDPPPWKSGWAYALYSAVVVGALGAFYAYQQKRIRDLQMKNRLVAVEKDLELTGLIQTGFLPKAAAWSGGGLAIHGFYKPADKASGDWWWYEQTGEDQILVVVGDVTGHGAGAAMVTAAASTAFRAPSGGNSSPLIDRFRAVNEVIYSIAGGEYRMTATAVEVNCSSGECRLYNAGGLPGLISRPGARKAKVVAAPGVPLGDGQFGLGEKSVVLAPGERLILLTDGIPEIEKPNGRMMGLAEFSSKFHGSYPQPLALAVTELYEHAMHTKGESVQDDDWTFTIIERSREPSVVS